MNIGFLLIGRLKSKRLPKKLLIEIKDKPIISHLLDRLKLITKVNEIIICTSNLDQDRPLAKIAEENNVKCFFGDPEDVLVRMLEAAEKHKLDYILTIGADCPFVDPYYADAIVETYLKTNADLIRQFDLPHGVFSYGIKTDALRQVVAIKDSSDTETWGKYFTDTGIFKIVDFDVKNKLHKRPDLRITLDYPEDLEFFKHIFDKLYKEGEIFSLDEIIKLINSDPEIVKINENLKTKFIQNWKKSSDIKLKKINNVSRAVIIGCGSIGQRHIKNLKEIGINEIIAFRSKKGFHKDLPKELGVTEVSSWNSVIEQKPDVAIVSNPTSLHIEYAQKLTPFVKGIFIEKPLSNSLDGIDDLINLLRKNNTVSFMGYNLMFHPMISSINDFIDSNDIGKIINIQCQVGQWLPDWHPYEDYTKSYVSKKNLGGGAALTLIHEIHLAMVLGGKPLEVCGMKSKSSLLEVDEDLDVISNVMIKHDSGCVSQIHLDFIQKPMQRKGLISFERGWISYDFNEKKAIAQKTEAKKPEIIWSDLNYDSNDMYIKQLKDFIKYVEERRVKHPRDIREGIESLKVVISLIKSYKEKKIIPIISNNNSQFD